ncbi:MAG: hypothetical protein IT286_01765 [Proteobacteria bacterium]|nr:hypothetical protein [Pseudomonadota bacterium]
MRKIGLIINPHAKKSRRDAGLISSLTNAFPSPTNVWLPKTLDELDAVTLQILNAGIEILFLSGGDGTFRATVESLIKNKSSHSLPQIILLQGGTGGLYSKHYYKSRHPLQHLKDALKRLDGDIPSHKINVLNVNGKYGFIFAAGGFANVLSYYMSHKERSIALANWIIFKLTLSFVFRTSLYKKMFPLSSGTIQINGTQRCMDMTTIACSTIPVGYILQPFTGIKLNQSFASIVFYKSPFRIFRHLRSIFRKKPIRSPDLETFNSGQIDLFFTHPLQPMVDGDMLEPSKEISVKLGPQIELLIL